MKDANFNVGRQVLSLSNEKGVLQAVTDQNVLVFNAMFDAGGYIHIDAGLKRAIIVLGERMSAEEVA